MVRAVSRTEGCGGVGACDWSCGEQIEQRRWRGKNWMERTTCELRTACAGASGSAVRREESLPSTSVEIIESRATKALPNITLSGTAALEVADALEGRIHGHSHDDVVKRQSTSLSASASLQSLRFLCFRVKSPCTVTSFMRACDMVSSTFLSDVIVPFVCLPVLWRQHIVARVPHLGPRTYRRADVLGPPRRNQDCARDLATVANAALEDPKYTCQLR